MKFRLEMTGMLLAGIAGFALITWGAWNGLLAELLPLKKIGYLEAVKITAVMGIASKMAEMLKNCITIIIEGENDW